MKVLSTNSNVAQVKTTLNEKIQSIEERLSSLYYTKYEADKSL